MPTDGWFKTHRALFSHPLFSGEEYCRGHAFNDLVGMAEFELTTRGVKGHPVKLERGELVASVRFLGDRWGWSKGKVQRFMERLAAENMVIEVRSETVPGSGTVVGTVYRIVNYEIYQGDPDGQRDGKRDTGGTPAGQIEEIKELTTSSTSSTTARADEKVDAITPPPDTDTERLRVYLGDHSRAVDEMLTSAVHPSGWAYSVWGKYGTSGTQLPIFAGIPRERWPAVLANALMDFALKRQVFDNRYFDTFVRKAANDERDSNRRDSGARSEAPAAAIRATGTDGTYIDSKGRNWGIID